MLPLLFLVLMADAPEKCAVAGTVVDSVTGKGVARATLLLEAVDKAKHHTATTVSGDDGSFSMVEVDAGQYRLTTRRGGYLESAYGARRHGWRGSVLTLEPGQTLKIEDKLVPAAVISGTVRNREGEPVENAHVVLARRTAEYGRPRLEGTDSTDTDDRGQYRLRGLEAGRYYVLAEVRQQEWDTVDHSPDGSKAGEADVTTWYPGAPDSSGASALTASAGAVLDGIDITLLRSRGFRVTGRVVGHPFGSRPPLTLLPLTDFDIGDLHPHTTVKDASGDFEFRNVPSGAYRLDGRNASTIVTVAGNDVEGVRLEFGAPGEIRGRVTVEGDLPPPTSGEAFLTYDGRRGTTMTFRPDLTFQATYVEDRKYAVEVMYPAVSKLYVKSVRSGDRDVLSEGLAFHGGKVSLDVVLASDGAVVEGVVANADGKPLLGATVVLVPPEGQRERSDLYRSATTDGSGKYVLDVAAPGEYKLFAWEDVEEGIWRDADFLKEFEKNAETVTLRPKDRKTVAVKVF
jgi:hypothetical protein